MYNKIRLHGVVVKIISHTRVHPKNDLVHLMQMPAEILYVITPDVPAIRLLVAVAHIAASCDDHESLDVISAPHHKKQSVELKFAGNRLHKIVHTRNLKNFIIIITNISKCMLNRKNRFFKEIRKSI